MAGCCTATSKRLNYLVMLLVFLAGALVIVIASYVLASNFRQFVRDWWIWIGIAAGILLIIVSLIGCTATHKQERFLLTIFLVIMFAVFALLCVVAIAASIYYGNLNTLNSNTFPQLNSLTGSDRDTYKFIREAYSATYTANRCSGGQCVFIGPVGGCAPITCEISSVAETFNKWLTAGIQAPGITGVTFATCIAQALGDDDFKGGANSASSWCGSSVRVLDLVHGWSLATLIGVWIITACVLLVCIGNCVLICGKKKHHRPPQGVVFAKPAEGVQVVTKV